MRIRNTGNERANKKKKKLFKRNNEEKDWLNFHVFTIEHKLSEDVAAEENGLSYSLSLLGYV